MFWRRDVRDTAPFPSKIGAREGARQLAGATEIADIELYRRGHAAPARYTGVDVTRRVLLVRTHR